MRFKLGPTYILPFVAGLLSLQLTSTAWAHGISESSHQTMAEGSLFDYVVLGAEHMVTGYDHLLFLFGVA